MRSSYWLVFDLIEDFYWCGIPLSCRECAFLERCRKGFWGRRKCYNGCLKLNWLRKQQRKRDREDYLNALVEQVEKEGHL